MKILIESYKKSVALTSYLSSELSSELSKKLSVKCTGKKHYNLQYGYSFFNNTNPIIYISIVKQKNTKRDTWSNINLLTYNIVSSKLDYSSSYFNLKTCHKKRLDILIGSLISRITK